MRLLRFDPQFLLIIVIIKCGRYQNSAPKKQLTPGWLFWSSGPTGLLPAVTTSLQPRTARPQGHEQQARATNELLRSDTNTICTKRGNVFRDVTSLFYGLNMDILDIIKSHANDIKTRFSVRRIGIFGSFARGEEKASSDIDILVEFEKPTFKNFMNLSFYLEDLLGREVDLVTVKGLHQRIRPYVEKDVIWSE